MPLKLNVGLSKKLGLPDYGSLGASCHVEVELEAALLQHDLEAFHRHVRGAFVACRQAVNDELARHVDGPAVAEGKGQRPAPASPAATAADRPARNESARNESTSANGHRASEKQLDYAQMLARQIEGLGVRRLEPLARKLYGKPLAELTGLDASGLIDTLKAVKAGQIDLEAALGGAGT